MNILIFGATGKVGSRCVSIALEKGYNVTAFVHGDSNIPSHEQLSICRGDIYDQVAVNEAIGQADVVLSALGSWGTPKKDILSQGMKHIIPAMERSGKRRIVSLTGVEAEAEGDSGSILHSISRVLLMVAAKKILVDGERHIAVLEESQLDWTVVRSPIMNDAGEGYRLTTTRPLPWQTINRQSVAEALVELVTSDGWNRAAPYIHR